MSERFNPCRRCTKFKKLDFVHGYHLGFNGLCHLTESGPIIASLHVWLVYLCSPTNLCPRIIYLITKSTRHWGSIGTSISMTTTLCRHVSHEHCSHLRNTFRRCATLIIFLWLSNHIKYYCPPTQTFYEKLLLKIMPPRLTNTFAFGSLVEGLPS